jgi:hypothetical protein
VHQASRLVNDLLLERPSHSYLPPGGAPVSFKRRLDGGPFNHASEGSPANDRDFQSTKAAAAGAAEFSSEEHDMTGLDLQAAAPQGVDEVGVGRRGTDHKAAIGEGVDADLARAGPPGERAAEQAEEPPDARLVRVRCPHGEGCWQVSGRQQNRRVQQLGSADSAWPARRTWEDDEIRPAIAGRLDLQIDPLRAETAAAPYDPEFDRAVRPATLKPVHPDIVKFTKRDSGVVAGRCERERGKGEACVTDAAHRLPISTSGAAV